MQSLHLRLCHLQVTFTGKISWRLGQAVVKQPSQACSAIDRVMFSDSRILRSLCKVCVLAGKAMCPRFICLHISDAWPQFCGSAGTTHSWRCTGTSVAATPQQLFCGCLASVRPRAEVKLFSHTILCCRTSNNLAATYYSAMHRYRCTYGDSPQLRLVLTGGG